MSHRFVEPYSFDSNQSDDKAFYRRSLTSWQQDNWSRPRVNSDMLDVEVNNAVSYTGQARQGEEEGRWYLKDHAGTVKLDFTDVESWKTNCVIPFQVVFILKSAKNEGFSRGSCV